MNLARTTKLSLLVLCALPMVAAAQPCPLAKGPGAAAAPGFGMGPGAGHGFAPGAHAAGRSLRGNWWSHPRVKEALELTEDQTKALSDASLQLRKEQIDVRADIEKARLELDEVLQADTVDEQKALEIAQNLGQLTGKQVELATRQRISVAKVLTPEQKEKAKEVLADRMRQRLQKGRQPAPAMRERARPERKSPEQLRAQKMERKRKATQ